jgi:hypothetical protein
MSTITVTNIKATGDTVNRVVSGIATVWCQYNADGSVDNSINVSSCVDVSTGSQEPNFTNHMSSANYSGVCTTQNNTDIGFSTVAADRYRTLVRLLSTQGAYDRNNNMLVIHGDLA